MNLNDATQNQSSIVESEIDFAALIATLRRRWRIVLASGLIGLSLAYVTTLVRKPVWQGEFQIVLSKKDAGSSGRMLSMAAANPLLSQFAGIAGADAWSMLDTEVSVLKSPLVLHPVFQFVKDYKLSNGIKSAKKLKFQAWAKNNLKINLQKGTLVLTVAYVDNDKNLVAQVLRRISSAYQNYSDRDRDISLKNALEFAKNQVAIFRQKAALSSKERDIYAINYGLSSGGSIDTSGVDASKLLNNPGSSSSFNIRAGQSTISPGVSGFNPDILAKLAAINEDLTRRRQLFTENDPAIKRLKRERDALRSYAESTAGGNLAIPGNGQLTKSAARDIFVKFQDLDRVAKRDSAALESFENTLMSLQLEQARLSRPWDLISSPYLMEKPISPRPYTDSIFGLILGIFSGAVFALLFDRIGGRVFSDSEIVEILQQPLLLKCSNVDATSLDLLAGGVLAKFKKIALIPVGKSSYFDLVCSRLAVSGPIAGQGMHFSLLEDLATAATYDCQLILVATGVCTRKELNEMSQKLRLQAKPVLGILIFSDAS